MPVSDDQKLAMWREVLQLCRVKPGQNVAVLTGETSLPQNIDMAVRASAALGARVCRIEVPPGDAGGAFGQRADVGITPLTGHRLVVDMLKKADMVLDLMGLLHSPEQLEILAAGTRILLVVEPPDMLARMIPSPDDKRRVQAAQKRLKTAKTMTVTSKAGTDLTMPLGQFPNSGAMGLLGRTRALGSLAERLRRHLAERGRVRGTPRHRFQAIFCCLSNSMCSPRLSSTSATV